MKPFRKKLLFNYVYYKFYTFLGYKSGFIYAYDTDNNTLSQVIDIVVYRIYTSMCRTSSKYHHTRRTIERRINISCTL